MSSMYGNRSGPIQKRVGALVGSGAMDARVVIRLVNSVVFAAVGDGALALRPHVLHRLGELVQHLHVRRRERVVAVEAVPDAYSFEEEARVACSWERHSADEARVVVVVHVV